MKANKLILLTASLWGIAILASASDKSSQSIILPDVEIAATPIIFIRAWGGYRQSCAKKTSKKQR